MEILEKKSETLKPPLGYAVAMISLNPADLRAEFEQFAQTEGITLHKLDIGINQEPFLVMNTEAVAEAVRIMRDPAQGPVLVFCSNGKVRTSCVVGCYRVAGNWSLVSTFHELERFSEPEGGQADLQFVENFRLE